MATLQHYPEETGAPGIAPRWTHTQKIVTQEGPLSLPKTSSEVTEGDSCAREALHRWLC